jgi:myo-inositol 2-dehydrogenase/D-chiro-inositol 1-dehydrogenase
MDWKICLKKYNAAIIASSTETNAKLLIKASMKGKAIFCENPIALEMEAVNNCLEIIKKNNSICMVGLNRRYDPNFVKLKELIDKGEIGVLEKLIITSHDHATSS